MPFLPPADIARIAHFDRSFALAIAEGTDLTSIIVRSDGGDYRFPMATTPPEDGQLPMVRGRVIALTTQLPQVFPRLSGGYGQQPQTSCTRRLGITVLDSSNGSATVVGDVRAVRGANLQASLDEILPLNPWTIKGNGGAEPTDRRIGVRPRSTRGKGALVAVIDNGINVRTHDEMGHTGRTDRWLSGIPVAASNTDPLTTENALHGNVMPGTGAPYLDNEAGHGTFVAGIVRRVAPAARVVVLKAFNTDGIANDLTVACRILQASDMGADVINLSLGTETLDGREPLAISRAIALVRKTTAIVASAGNTGRSQRVWPAADPRVIAVAALDYTGRKAAPFSTRGPWVDASAIGQGVVSTYVDGVERPAFDPDLPDSWSGRNPIAMWSGTSFSAPQVSGLIAAGVQKAGSGIAAWQVIRRRGQGLRTPNLGMRLRILLR